jgi:Xaa-Pro aminopeptidase
MTTRGYNHSLGHGLGLRVHEAPILSDMPGSSAPLLPGAVITIEPGLYDAEAGYGVRIEDTFFADAQGAWHSLSPFPKNLVIPMD